jgi:hypothetical protein
MTERQPSAPICITCLSAPVEPSQRRCSKCAPAWHASRAAQLPPSPAPTFVEPLTDPDN